MPEITLRSSMRGTPCGFGKYSNIFAIRALNNKTDHSWQCSVGTMNHHEFRTTPQCKSIGSELRGFFGAAVLVLKLFQVFCALSFYDSQNFNQHSDTQFLGGQS